MKVYIENNYTIYKKSRRLFELFYLIKSGITNKEELAQLFNTDKKTIYNYIQELNSEFDTLIEMDTHTNSYIIIEEGILKSLNRNFLLSADDAILILATLVKSQSIMETKMGIIKNSLLGLLQKEEANKLKDMLYFEKTGDLNQHTVESNVTQLRKAIGEEKKVRFTYTSSSGEHSDMKMIPYSFAAEFGKFYIVGKPESHETLKHFRIDRIGQVYILNEDGKKDRAFNVNDYLRKVWYMYSGEDIKVIVKFKSRSKIVVIERSMIEGRILEETEEYFKYEFSCFGYKGIKLWLMGFGSDAEVLEPVELREEIISDIKGMVNNYKV
jgi:predicted DNA-binding transcriptional regulator YafY